MLTVKNLILNPRGWFHDSEVEAAKKLLKMRFPLVDGLEEPAIIGNLVTPAKSEFYSNNQHWFALGVYQHAVVPCWFCWCCLSI